MTGRQLGRKSSSNIQVDRRPQTALKVLHTQEEEWKQQTKCWPCFLRAGRCSSREFKGETEIIVDEGGKNELLIIVHHHRAPNQTIQQNLCLFTCDPARHNLWQMNVGLCSTSRLSDLRPERDQYARVHLRIRGSRWKQPKSRRVKRKHGAERAADTFDRLWFRLRTRGSGWKEKKKTWQLIEQNCVGEERLWFLMLRCAPPVDPDGKNNFSFFSIRGLKVIAFFY